MHRNAIPTASFAEAAGAQGKFWEMHDKIYEGQKGLGKPHRCKYCIYRLCTSLV